MDNSRIRTACKYYGLKRIIYYVLKCLAELFLHAEFVYSVPVYVILSEHNGMVDMMSNLEHRGLLATGDYVVIHVDLGTFSNIIPLKYFRRKQ